MFKPGQTLLMQTYDDGQLRVQHVRPPPTHRASDPGEWHLIEVLEKGALYEVGELVRVEAARLTLAR